MNMLLLAVAHLLQVAARFSIPAESVVASTLGSELGLKADLIAALHDICMTYA